MTQSSPSSRHLPIPLAALLLAALALPCFAQAPASHSTATAADASFVASLAAPVAPALAPAPTFLQTGAGCTSDAQCPTGKLCCPACRFPGCTKMACYTPVNGVCP
jgi:hypothetical protein